METRTLYYYTIIIIICVVTSVVCLLFSIIIRYADYIPKVWQSVVKNFVKFNLILLLYHTNTTYMSSFLGHFFFFISYNIYYIFIYGKLSTFYVTVSKCTGYYSLPKP